MIVGKINALIAMGLAIFFSSWAEANELAKAEGVQQIGRAKVALPGGNAWHLLDDATRNQKISGLGTEIPSQAKVWVLLSPNKDLLSMVYVRASEAWGYAQGSIIWNITCVQNGKSYIVDGVQGGPGRRDCLAVAGRVNMKSGVPPILEAAGSRMKEAGLRLPDQMLAIAHSVGNDKGAFVETLVYTSVTFRGASGEPGQPSQLNTIKAPTARWGDLLASAARSSLNSLSGEYKLPDMNFSE